MSIDFTKPAQREAILRAADMIEQNPLLYSWDALHVPACGTPGCMLGLIGVHLGMLGEPNINVAIAIGLMHSAAFYDRIEALTVRSPDWYSAQFAERALRLYADTYHPAQHTGIPAAVRAIFEEQTAEEQMA